MDKLINKVASSEAILKPQYSNDIAASNLKRSDPQTSNSQKAKPLASISLDLDNLWSYMKTHGDPGWQSFSSYLDTFIPLVLDVLDDLNLKITFFIVGQDAALEKNRDVLKLVTDQGHEVGNHSFHHEPWMILYTKNKIEKEILEAEEQIFRVTGQKPIGFRGPGFVCSKNILEILADNKYLYDASTFPTYLGPLARMYYFWTSNLTGDEKNQRKTLFGSFKDGFRPGKPYIWKLPSREPLLEIPVTTIPFIKTPFHLSYLLYLSRFSEILMLFYLQLAIGLCKATRTAPSFLLHPLDFLGSDQVPELAFFPGMDLGSERKMAHFYKVIDLLSRHYCLVSLGDYATFIQSQSATHMVPIQQLNPAL